MVGIVHKRKWVKSSSEKFSSYINYIDREEAVRNYKIEDYSLFNDYMGNPKKCGNLFTSDKDFLNEDERKELKRCFSIAQENKSFMWQDVFSFDNEWLEKQGLYDRRTGALDEKRIMEAVRNSMSELIEKEKFNSLIWSASMHFNTDNIHVHIASVELDPTRYTKEDGFIKYKNLYKMKSKFANTLIDRSKEQKEINNIIRNNIIDGKKEISFHKDIEMKRMVTEIIKKLPEDKRQWQYGYNSLYEVKPLLNELTKYYIDNYKKNEFDKLIEALDSEEEYLKEVYGEGEKGFYKNYKQNKIDELYYRMGNTILREIKNEVVKKKESDEFIKNYTNRNVILNAKDIQRLKKAFDKDFEKIKNELAYERLQREIEYNNGVRI
ncbi:MULTISPECIES: MobP2 family relaxase [Clostridium]|uniref:MobP2 family relaxase n=1 Tax=Clostridium TaxID=1485 RepID=UPI00232FABAD|nr:MULTISPECIES: MobP2 family relaxase [Clostridium]MDB2104841.1 relaxase MobL [Clostridium paraputrificum]MDU2108693.1 MobP2 family relaxase [Clostridium sp.]MDU3355196.1 MobP2 family relaxase [Clostridium sp.]MDU4727946.1 MobP2 family relaxase [Clostridium sp.]